MLNANHQKKAWFTGLVLTTMCNLSFAYEEEDSLSAISLEDLLNLEVSSASKIATPIAKAPAIITAYTNQQLNQYNYVVINDLLYSMPGFGPGQDYERPTVPTRGNFDSWSNNHILHLVDGIPVNDNLYGTAYTWLAPIFFSKTIEVIRGPGSALYGSNATNGVVQMNTFNGADLSGKIHAKITPIAGTDDSRRVEAMAGTTSGDYDFIMAYAYSESDGNTYPSYDGSGRLATLSDPNFNGRPRLAEFDTRDRNDNSYFWAKLTKGENLSFQYHHQAWDFDTGHGWFFEIPDFEEEMNEYRDILSIKYNFDYSEQLSIETLARYQKHHITWNQRYYPNGAFDFYEDGMWEYIDSEGEDMFFRLQGTYFFGEDSNATFLAGLEIDRFNYDGDDAHYSNVNVDCGFDLYYSSYSDTCVPAAGAVQVYGDLGKWLDYLSVDPVINTALYMQLTTGNWISEDFEVTLGLRSDKLSVDFKNLDGFIDAEGNLPGAGQTAPAKLSKDWSKVSPRVAGVWTISDGLVGKMMWGKAFRAPQPTEMGGAHTGSLASNITQLDAEEIETFEAMLDWKINENYILRSNIFMTEFANQIAFSSVNANLSTNVNSTENFGTEIELIANYGKTSWFANLSYVQRNDETILSFSDPGDPSTAEFSPHPDDLVWEPELKLNLGAAFNPTDNFQVSFNLHYHGEVERRDSELGTAHNGVLPFGEPVPVNLDLNDHRPSSIDAWVSLNSRVSYRFTEGVKFLVDINNLFDEEARLAKTGTYPFDYQIKGRQIMAYLEVAL
ncbi:TonB-dependent receptor [Aliikangiella sp. G2MR2-5]|uniref:TonB-dependent receptor n=1 Tax=Aliikangiella sp. G2MR2-5 TaxID=2788943 RepID=UPI0018AA1E72|nr:TonB-dependent receptor [Aliikangiella sp. G2MR2-5]